MSIYLPAAPDQSGASVSEFLTKETDMHIVEAFETAKKNRDSVNKDLSDLMMSAIQSGDKDLAQKLDALSKKVSGILTPFTE